MKNGYTIIIASDFHSNATACEAWIKAVRKKQPDEIYLLGDYVSDYPMPQDTLAQLYALAKEIPTTFLRGNREEYFLDPSPDWKPSSQNGSLYHTLQHLQPNDLSFFSSLPISRLLSFQGAPSIIIAHGSPTNSIQQLRPASNAISELLRTISTDFLIAGHTHCPCIQIEHGHCYIN